MLAETTPTRRNTTSGHVIGCGPCSFNEQIFSHHLQGYPQTILESDGHGGAAGFVTRIQAFLQSVRQYQEADSPAELVGRQKLDDLVAAIGMPKEKLCTHCWDGSSCF